MNTAFDHLSSKDILNVLALAPNATAIYTGQELIIQSANDVMISFWGKDRSVIGTPLEQAVPELKGQQFINLLRGVWNTGVTYEAQNTPADLQVNGLMQTFYYDFVYRPIKDENGRTYCILHTATDVTDRNLNNNAQESLRKKQKALETEQILNEELAVANEELRAINDELQESQHKMELLNFELETRVENRTRALAKSEARIRSILNNAPVGIAVVNADKYIIETANYKMLEFWGREQSVIGNTLLKIWLPESNRQPFLHIIARVFASGEPYFKSEEKVYTQHDGKPKEGYYNILFHPIKNETEEIISIIIIATEITAQVVAKRELQRTEEMLRFSLEAANIGTWYLEIGTGDFIPSARLKELFGFYEDETMPYAAAINQIKEEYQGKMIAAMDAAINENKPYEIEYPIIGYHDHKLRWVKAFGKLYADFSGKSAHFSGVMMDITEQKQDELRKNDFIGMVSHELKTPLTSLSGYLQLVNSRAKKAEDAFTTGLLDKASAQIKKMNALISGFLNVSRLESGKIHLEKQNFVFNDLINEITNESGLIVSTHKIQFHLCDPIHIFADRDKIGTVISNLLSNAIKYSSQGSTISVRCSVKENQVQLSVEDEGMGIKPQDIEKLFERFYRVEGTNNQTISGFGIGLYLCAEIIQRHEGKIWVDSELGKGSTFSFSLPL